MLRRTLVLAPRPGAEPMPQPQHLNALACRFFEGAERGAAHHAAKPWSAGPVRHVLPDLLLVDFAWLPDKDPPDQFMDLARGVVVKIGCTGRDLFDVVHVSDDGPVRLLDFASLPGCNAARMHTISPIIFTSNGQAVEEFTADRALRSMITRWNLAAESGPFEIPAELRRALVDAVAMDGMLRPTLVPARFTAAGTPLHKTAFDGEVDLYLTRADDAMRSVFGAVNRLAAVGGVGSMTTHGWGAVRTSLGDAALVAA